MRLSKDAASGLAVPVIADDLISGAVIQDGSLKAIGTSGSYWYDYREMIRGSHLTRANLLHLRRAGSLDIQHACTRVGRGLVAGCKPVAE